MPRPAVIHWMSPAADGAVVAHAVAVLDGAGQHVGDGLDAAVRVPGEAGQVVLGNVVAEIVEQKEGIEIGGIAEAERAAQVHAGAFQRGFGLDEPLDRSDGHVSLQNKSLATRPRRAPPNDIYIQMSWRKASMRIRIPRLHFWDFTLVARRTGRVRFRTSYT